MTSELEQHSSTATSRTAGAATAADALPSNDGYRALLRALWRRGRASEPFRCIDIAEVAFVEDGSVAEWFFTDKDGALRRKHGASTSNEQLVNELRKQRRRGAGCEFLALAYMQQQPGGAAGVVPLTHHGLQWLLMGHPSRRKGLRAVQRFVSPRGARECVLRADWRAQLIELEMRCARQPLAISTIAPEERLSTFSPILAHSQQLGHVPSAASEMAPAVCAALSDVLQSDLPRDERRVVADLKLVAAGPSSAKTDMVLLWAALAPTNGPFPEHLFPASQPLVRPPTADQLAVGGNDGNHSLVETTQRPLASWRASPQSPPSSRRVRLGLTRGAGAAAFSSADVLCAPPSDSRDSLSTSLPIDQPGQPRSQHAPGGPAVRPNAANAARAPEAVGRRDGKAGRMLCSKLFQCAGCARLESREFAQVLLPERWTPPAPGSFARPYRAASANAALAPRAAQQRVGASARPHSATTHVPTSSRPVCTAAQPRPQSGQRRTPARLLCTECARLQQVEGPVC